MNHAPHRNPAELRAARHRGARRTGSNLIRGWGIHFCYPHSSQSNTFGHRLLLCPRQEYVRLPGHLWRSFEFSSSVTETRASILAANLDFYYL